LCVLWHVPGKPGNLRLQVQVVLVSSCKFCWECLGKILIDCKLRKIRIVYIYESIHQGILRTESGKLTIESKVL
jgi:hypothetical protein